MRRIGWIRNLSSIWALALLISAGEALAQQGPINPRTPPPPPPEQPAPPPPQPLPQPEVLAAPAPRPQPVAPPPNLPVTVSIPAGTHIPVVLDTPLSTRIAKQGQLVNFRTSDSVRLAGQLDLPPDTVFTGSVIEVRRPGSFGRSGVLRVKVDRLNLPSGRSADVYASLDSMDPNGYGRTRQDRRSADLLSLAMYTIEGTLIGSQIKGGKGAAVGAGAGAAVALAIAMSHRGSDVYLEPGMPFQVILDQAVELPSKDVFSSQQAYAQSHPSAGNHDSTVLRSPGSAVGRGVDQDDENDPDRPKLKHRPKRLQP